MGRSISLNGQSALFLFLILFNLMIACFFSSSLIIHLLNVSISPLTNKKVYSTRLKLPSEVRELRNSETGKCPNRFSNSCETHGSLNPSKVNILFSTNRAT